MIISTVDTDILKPDTGYLSVIERPSGSSPRASTTVSSGETSPKDKYTEPVSEGEEDEDMDLAPARDEDKRTGLTGDQIAEAVAYREKMLKERAAAEKQSASSSKGTSRERFRDEEAVEGDDEGDERTPFLKRTKSGTDYSGKTKQRVLSIDPLAPSSMFDEELRNRLKGESAKKGRQVSIEAESPDNERGSLDDEEEDENRGTTSEDRILSRNWRAPSGKRISVPVRVEPKVYFAAERTFLASSSVNHHTLKLTFTRNG